ncbi:COMM domain-containing protein 9-like isoform X2 [Mercenaria mercenaria]|uniref:COMM domain-containing protein 9-like isoform X2 n=1 Tax=Mercenaria mercenaria TaxID=6596 RepID=UPI00234E4E5F|nr:COMM domain-containing protein 9-like isoform X2 [Mercenaria mercenaria]
MATCNFVDISCLVKAPSKDVVHKTCQEAFLYRDRRKVPEAVVSNIATQYGISPEEAKKLLMSLGSLMKSAVFQGSTDPSDLIKLFPSDFHKSLRDLLAKIMIENMSTWRAQAVNNQVSLPRMVDFDWRVDIKTSSDSIARMSVPTCILQMKVQENPSRVDTVADVSNVNVELSKETLDTMLDGLSKIRDQLSSVANR